MYNNAVNFKASDIANRFLDLRRAGDLFQLDFTT